MDIFAAVLCN